MNIRTPTVLVAVVVSFAVGAAAQNDFSDVEMKATHVAGNVYMLKGAGGNIGVTVGEDGIIIVDDQFAPLAGKIRAALEDVGAGELAFILNTHWHGDHTGGNAVFGPEATIIAHDNVRKRLAAGSVRRPPSPREALPVITFDSSLSIHFNGEEIKVIHFPKGHTDGDCVIFFTKSNVVHMGDHFFADRFPFVDLDSGGDVEGFIGNVEQVIAGLAPGVKIIPGHGELSDVDGLERYRDMLVETTGIVREAMKRGESLDEIKAAGLPRKWRSWSWDFISTERWIEIVYQSYEE